MKQPGLNRYQKIIERFSQVKVLVIGDVMVDEFIWGKVSRISPEAPIPIVQVESESFMPGGAANVINNISGLSGMGFIAGVIGNDSMGKRLVRELHKRGVDAEGLIVDKNRPTILKRRIIAHSQQVVRMDREVVRDMEGAVARKLLTYIRKILPVMDAVVISDYGKGVITHPLLQEVIHLCQLQSKPITVDPKVNHFLNYKYVTAITPNQYEVEESLGVEIKDEAELEQIGAMVRRRLKCQALLITRGEKGMSLFEAHKRVAHIPTVAREIYDVSGAGDTVIGTLTLALACGASIKDAAYLSNFAAGVVVGEVGTATVSRVGLQDAIRQRVR